MGKFKMNKMSQDDIESFPFYYLNSNCANWSITNSIKFVKEFYKKVDINYLYSEIIQDLKLYYKIK